MTLHAAAVGLLCLALVGSLGACAAGTTQPAGSRSQAATPQPSPGGDTGSAGASPSASATSSPSASPSPSPTRSIADGLIVFDGDSLTEGFMLETGQSYPAQAMGLLPDGIRYENVAVSGQTWPDMLADVTVEVDPLYSATNDFNILVVWAGANDLAAGYTAEQVYENARAYCLARKQLGFTVVTCTMYPLEPRGEDQYYETLRLEYNRLLRENWPQFADALVDLAADERIGDHSPASRADYFVDIVHLNQRGYAVIADAVVDVVGPLVEAAY